MDGLDVEWLGCVPYGQALSRQAQAVADRRRGIRGDRLLLLEHPPVVTLGSAARREHLLVSEAELAARGVELFRARRGGDVTFHGPGQLVGYLVVDLATRGVPDVHRFLRRVEQALIDALAGLGLPARRVAGRTGVFAAAGAGPARKLGSIGVGLRHWVTWHGFALNVSLDLQGFEVIVPCGLRDVEMTSVARELGVCGTPALDRHVREQVGRTFARAFAPGAAPLPAADAVA